MFHRHSIRTFIYQALPLLSHGLLGLSLIITPGFIQQVQAQTTTPTDVPLANGPIFSAAVVPGNLAFTLSVEHPTASTKSYRGNYNPASTYLGYFDPNKCYLYHKAQNAPEQNSHFYVNSTSTDKTCSGANEWSGNFMNWASMQSLDTFRWVLTGGNRVVDSTTETILQKTYFAINGGDLAPDETTSGATNIGNATPLSWSKLITSIKQRGVGMAFSCESSYLNGTLTEYSGTGSPTCTSSNKNPQFVYINVKVCDTPPDANNYHNCQAYGNNYKPEGLIQKYSTKLRYAAFGYLNEYAPSYNHSDLAYYQRRDGGVLRAAMSYVGPQQPVPGSQAINNVHTEWDANTGVMIQNPQPTDALNTQTTAGAGVTVPYSGVINYINKFGYASQGKYKSFSDAIGELYYAALRYLRGMREVPEYSNLVYPAAPGKTTPTATTNIKKEWVDGFPVITNWKQRGDPILYSCQKNFILGIGDVITHKDRNLPGVSSSFRNAGTEPAMPSAVSNDTDINVTQATNKIGVMEGTVDIGTSSISGANLGATESSIALDDSYFLAGLAYYAHTNDIRPDLAGKQTISTFWMDVLEINSSYTSSIPSSTGYMKQNKYWLATKYGGFDVPDDFNYATRTTPLNQSWWNKNNQMVHNVSGAQNDLRPENYFTAKDPEQMKQGLEEAFAKIVSEAEGASTTSYATASPNVNSGNASYGSSYSPKHWTGDVTASSVSYAADGTFTRTPTWSAAQIMNDAAAASTTWPTATRKVITYCDASSIPSGIPFTATDLTTCTNASSSAADTRRLNYNTFAMVTGVSPSSQNASNFVAYLRGNRTHEISNNGPYRSRGGLLGDIINSKLNPVSAPASPYSDTTNPGYSTFKATHLARKHVVYVGANDGMLHAFDGSLTGTTRGQELFAFIPSFVYGNATTGPESGLASLGAPAFTHHNLVDGTARHFDVDFARSGAPASAATASDWRTILIGGLGKGGRGYYAIDITNPASWTSETAVASKVLWEFPRSNDATTKARMGYSFGEPSVVKTHKYGWVVIFSSGYNNDDGKGYFFIVNPKNGDLLETVTLPGGSTTSPINMAHQRAFIPDYTDYTADAVYAGDLRGNVWRLDLTKTTGNYDAPTKIAVLTNAAGDALPVTTRPVIEADPSSKKRYVMIGTGRLLDGTDINSSSLQSFYAIVDGTATAGGFWSTPPNDTFPLTRSDLNANTALTTGIGSSPASSFGWYYDLGSITTAGGSVIAERVNIDADANYGIVAFTANMPNGDACNPTGSGRVFAVRFATGKSVLVDTSGAVIESFTNTTGTVTDLLIQRVNGRIRLNVGDSGGNAGNVRGDMSSGLGLSKLNWREVPNQD